MINIEKYKELIPKCISGAKLGCATQHNSDVSLYCPNCLKAKQLIETFTNYETLKDSALTYLEISESTTANKLDRDKLRYYATNEL